MKTKHIHIMNVLFALFICISLYVLSHSMHKEIDLSISEKAWLAEHADSIVIAPDPFSPPLDSFDKAGNHIGFSADYISIIEEKLSTPFYVAHYDSWEMVLDKALTKEVSIVSLAMRTPEREGYLNFTTPIVNVPNVIVVNKSNPNTMKLKDFAGKELVVPAGYAVQEYIERAYPEINLVTVGSAFEGLKKVSFGEQEAMVVDLGQVTYLVQQHGITNLRVSSETEYELNLSYAVRKDWPELLDILNKVIGSIDRETHEEIFRKWISLEYIPFWQSSLFWRKSLALLSFILLPIAVMILWNISLRQKVQRKTAELRDELNLRHKVEHQLHRHKQELEMTVLNRTKELEQKNKQLEKARFELEKLSVTDSLTGLKNRRYLFQIINEQIAKAKREVINKQMTVMDSAAFGLSFFMIDIDHFKDVNDEYGHESGDVVLKSISDILKKQCRKSDTLIRWGGEEFLVVVHAERRQQLEAFAERIRSCVACSNFKIKEGKSIHCTCSIGFASYPFIANAPDEISWEEVISLADKGLYMAKVEKRDAWVGVCATEKTQPEKVREGDNNFPDLIKSGVLSVYSSLPQSA